MGKGGHGREREDKLLEQVDAMFPRYSREHDALSGLAREFSEAFSLGEELNDIKIGFTVRLDARDLQFTRSYTLLL